MDQRKTFHENDESMKVEKIKKSNTGKSFNSLLNSSLPEDTSSSRDRERDGYDENDDDQKAG